MRHIAALLSGPALAAGDPSVEDLLWDLHVVPLDAEPAPPFVLPTLEGDRMPSADLRGRVVMLYFWITT